MVKSHVIKSGLGSVFMCLMAMSGLAAQWETIADTEGYRLEVDQESIQGSGKRVQAWDRITPPGGLAADSDGFIYRYIMTWSDYDCDSGRINTRRRVYVGEDIRQIKEPNFIYQPNTIIVGGTPRQKLWSRVCNLTLAATQVVIGDFSQQRIEKSSPSTPHLKMETIEPLLLEENEPKLLPNRQASENRLPPAAIPIALPPPEVLTEPQMVEITSTREVKEVDAAETTVSSKVEVISPAIRKETILIRRNAQGGLTEVKVKTDEKSSSVPINTPMVLESAVTSTTSNGTLSEPASVSSPKWLYLENQLHQTRDERIILLESDNGESDSNIDSVAH